jgi:hypothetical protein
VTGHVIDQDRHRPYPDDRVKGDEPVETIDAEQSDVIAAFHALFDEEIRVKVDAFLDLAKGVFDAVEPDRGAVFLLLRDDVDILEKIGIDLDLAFHVTPLGLASSTPLLHLSAS